MIECMDNLDSHTGLFKDYHSIAQLLLGYFPLYIRECSNLVTYMVIFQFSWTLLISTTSFTMPSMLISDRLVEQIAVMSFHPETFLPAQQDCQLHSTILSMV